MGLVFYSFWIYLHVDLILCNMSEVFGPRFTPFYLMLCIGLNTLRFTSSLHYLAYIGVELIKVFESRHIEITTYRNHDMWKQYL